MGQRGNQKKSENILKGMMIGTTYQNLWDVVMVVFKEKFILLSANIKKRIFKTKWSKLPH